MFVCGRLSSFVEPEWDESTCAQVWPRHQAVALSSELVCFKRRSFCLAVRRSGLIAVPPTRRVGNTLPAANAPRSVRRRATCAGAYKRKTRGWARLLLGRTRDLITHGAAHRGASGVAMPTDEDDQDGHFLFNHPERGGQLCCRLGTQSRCCHCLDPIPPH